jgi:hypothetical protein
MLHAGLDLSRKRIDVCLLSESGEHVDQLAAPPDADGLRSLARRIDEAYREPVCGVIESMTGARLVHDTLEREGWDVEIADAQKGEGPGAAGLQDRQDRLAGAGGLEPPRPGAGDLAPRPPDPGRARARPLSPPPGQAQVGAQELDPDQLRENPARSPTSSEPRAENSLPDSRSRSPGEATSRRAWS